MLLINDHQPQLAELNLLLQQRVRANHQLCVALRDVPSHFALAIRFQRARQQDDAVPGILQNSPRRKIMLLRQDLGRRHQRHLATILDRDNRRLEPHNRLARSHISLQQTPHGIRLLHVRGNLFQHPLLRRSGMKRQNLLDRRPHPVVQPECDPRLRLLLAPLQFHPEFDEEQLIEDHPQMCRSTARLQVLEAFARLRPMHVPQRGPRRDQPQMRAHGGRNRVRQIGRQVVERRADRLPKPARSQPPNRFINRNDASDLQRLGRLFLGAVVSESVGSPRISNCGWMICNSRLR